MDRCLLHLPHESIDALIHRRQVSTWEVRRTMESLGELVKHGAIWQPDDSRQMDYIRRGLYQVKPEVTVDLLELFVKTKSCSSGTMQSLSRTPRIRQHLKPHEQRLLRLRLDLRTTREKAEQLGLRPNKLRSRRLDTHICLRVATIESGSTKMFGRNLWWQLQRNMGSRMLDSRRSAKG